VIDIKSGATDRGLFNKVGLSIVRRIHGKRSCGSSPINQSASPLSLSGHLVASLYGLHGLRSVMDCVARTVIEGIVESSRLTQIRSVIMPGAPPQREYNVNSFLKPSFSSSCLNNNSDDITSPNSTVDFSKVPALIIAGPSASGKTSLVKRIVAAYPDAFGAPAVTVTKSPGSNGLSDTFHRFVSEARFSAEDNKGELLMTRFSHGYYWHGVRQDELIEAYQDGKMLIFESASIKGINKIKGVFKQVFVIAILPMTPQEFRSEDKATIVSFFKGALLRKDAALKERESEWMVRALNAKGNFEAVAQRADLVVINQPGEEGAAQAAYQAVKAFIEERIFKTAGSPLDKVYLAKIRVTAANGLQSKDMEKVVAAVGKNIEQDNRRIFIGSNESDLSPAEDFIKADCEAILVIAISIGRAELLEGKSNVINATFNDIAAAIGGEVIRLEHPDSLRLPFTKITSISSSLSFTKRSSSSPAHISPLAKRSRDYDKGLSNKWLLWFIPLVLYIVFCVIGFEPFSFNRAGRPLKLALQAIEKVLPLKPDYQTVLDHFNRPVKREKRKSSSSSVKGAGAVFALAILIFSLSCIFAPRLRAMPAFNISQNSECDEWFDDAKQWRFESDSRSAARATMRGFLLKGAEYDLPESIFEKNKDAKAIYSELADYIESSVLDSELIKLAATDESVRAIQGYVRELRLMAVQIQPPVAVLEYLQRKLRELAGQISIQQRKHRESFKIYDDGFASGIVEYKTSGLLASDDKIQPGSIFVSSSLNGLDVYTVDEGLNKFEELVSFSANWLQRKGFPRTIRGQPCLEVGATGYFVSGKFSGIFVSPREAVFGFTTFEQGKDNSLADAIVALLNNPQVFMHLVYRKPNILVIVSDSEEEVILSVKRIYMPLSYMLSDETIMKYFDGTPRGMLSDRYVLKSLFQTHGLREVPLRGREHWEMVHNVRRSLREHPVVLGRLKRYRDNMIDPLEFSRQHHFLMYQALKSMRPQGVRAVQNLYSFLRRKIFWEYPRAPFFSGVCENAKY
ncbi:MAG: hypothetical protein ABH858_02575, partial [Candidatus Omnitrophota bacterium]